MSSTQPSTSANSAETTDTPSPTAPSIMPVPAAPEATAKSVAPKRVKAPAKKRALPVKAMAPLVIESAIQPVAKPVAKPGRKAVVAPIVHAAPPASKPATVPVAKPLAEKLLKDKKPKLVRDSFTIPKVEYIMLDQLKQRGGTLGRAVKKSELIRAGIKALALLSDADFLAAIQAVPTIKTGRPAND